MSGYSFGKITLRHLNLLRDSVYFSDYRGCVRPEYPGIHFFGACVLLCCMYHRVEADKLSNSLPILERHFEYIRQNFQVVVPGEVLAADMVNLCMVFDDASYSFYSYVFPLMQKFGIRVVLAVAPKFIIESAGHIPSSRRLGVPTDELMLDDRFAVDAPFCSWQELSEICASGFVTIASHSFSHPNLLRFQDTEDELVRSKKTLEENLRCKVDSFVYPYGQFNRLIAERVRSRYKYSFAIGAGDNVSWDGVGGILFRAPADDLKDPVSIFSKWNLRKYEILRSRLFVKKWLMDRRSSIT